MSVSDHYALTIDEYYKDHSIYKSLVVCKDAQELIELAGALDNLNHSVFIPDFNETSSTSPISTFLEIKYRLFITTYNDFIANFESIKMIVLPEQNLIMYTDIPDKDLVISLVKDAANAGYRLKDHPLYFLDLT